MESEPVNTGWLNIFLEGLVNTKKVLIVSPFVTDNMVGHLVKNMDAATEISLITRYNLNDFRSRVSSLSALSRLLQKGAVIKGVRGLHTKLYVFDQKSAIITSANFTGGGFFNNYEYGIKTTDPGIITKSIEYFISLSSLDNKMLTEKEIGDWKTLIAKKGVRGLLNDLPDFGKEPVRKITPQQKFFIKFFGKNEYRVGLDYHTLDQIKDSQCHFAVMFSGKKGRPRKYKTGDIVFMAMMLHENDYAIFGKAIAIEHDDQRDVASPEDIEEVEWKEEWPVYIRVHSAEFINATMKDCPKMSELINELDYDSFMSTQQRYLNGESDINPYNSLRQQADVQLSNIGATWLENRFQKALGKKGKVDQALIDSMYQGSYDRSKIPNLTIR